jgi:hypothetical protein
MDNFPIRSKNLFQGIFADVGVKATNKYLSSNRLRSQQKTENQLRWYRKVELRTHGGIARIIVGLSSLSICIWYCKWKQKVKKIQCKTCKVSKGKHECISCRSSHQNSNKHYTVIFKQIQTFYTIYNENSSRKLGATTLSQQTRSG